MEKVTRKGEGGSEREMESKILVKRLVRENNNIVDKDLVREFQLNTRIKKNSGKQ